MGAIGRPAPQVLAHGGSAAFGWTCVYPRFGARAGGGGSVGEGGDAMLEAHALVFEPRGGRTVLVYRGEMATLERSAGVTARGLAEERDL